MPHTFDDLVQLEQAAVDAHSRYTADPSDITRQAWIDAAAVFQAAVTEHAAAEGKSRVEVEMAAKKAVRHVEAAD